MNFKKHFLTVIWLIIWTFLIMQLLSCSKEKKAHSVGAVIVRQKPAEISGNLRHIEADTLFDRAQRLVNSKLNDSALLLHLWAYQIRDSLSNNSEKLVESCLVIARIYLLSDKFDRAIKYLEKARQIAETTSTSSEILFEIYKGLSQCNYEMRNFPDATSFAQRMLNIATERNSVTEKTYAYRRFAAIEFFQKNHERAIDNWLKAATLCPTSDHVQLGSLFYNVATAYWADKQNENALLYIDKAIVQDLADTSRPAAVASRYITKAMLLLELKKSDLSLPLLRKALSIRRKFYGPKNLYTFGANHSLGQLYEALGQYDSALWYHQQSLMSLVRSLNNPDWRVNPIPAPDELDNNLVLGLISKAEVLKKFYKTDSTQIYALNLCLATDFLADSVFEEYKKNIVWDESLLAQMESGGIPYAEMLAEVFSLYQLTNDQKCLQDALNIIERSRASVLQAGLKKAIAFGSAGVPNEFQAREKRLMSDRSSIIQSLAHTDLRKSARDSLQETLITISDNYLKLQDQLRKTNPSYFAIRFSRQSTDLELLQGVLKDKNSILLVFFCTRENIYTLAIKSEQISLIVVPLSDDLSRAIEMFKHEFQIDPEGSLKLNRYQNFCSNSWLIYERLVKDLLKDVEPETHLIISADGPLATIPFEALTTMHIKSQEVNYHLPYLVDKYPLSYCYSTTVLMNQIAIEREGSRLLAMGYAGPGSSRENRSRVNDLPGTEEEIRAIKNVMKNDVNHYYLEGGSSEANFKKHVGNYDVVHLALHGEGDTLNAMNSKLIFRTEHDSIEDGQLYAHELYSLDLRSLDLAVLSACESGIGKQQRGEGVMSIARGFAYAGCPSLVISLWKIDDHTTAQIMSKFYGNLSQANPLDVSLAAAKRDYLKNASELNSHPFYWAAFLQVGSTEQLDVKKPNWWCWALAILIILAFVQGAIYLRLRR